MLVQSYCSTSGIARPIREQCTLLSSAAGRLAAAACAPCACACAASDSDLTVTSDSAHIARDCAQQRAQCAVCWRIPAAKAFYIILRARRSARCRGGSFFDLLVDDKKSRSEWSFSLYKMVAAARDGASTGSTLALAPCRSVSENETDDTSETTVATVCSTCGSPPHVTLT
eukprot:scaffold10558_cov111-Isochrysis_galbana.AAC.3